MADYVIDQTWKVGARSMDWHMFKLNYLGFWGTPYPERPKSYCPARKGPVHWIYYKTKGWPMRTRRDG